MSGRKKRDDKEIKLLASYLGQYRRTKQRQQCLELRLEEIRRNINSPIGGANYKPINRPKNSASAGAASLTFRLSDCELRIYDQKEQAERDLLKIMDIFDYLDKNSDERAALEMHYIDGLKWEQVADELPCSRSQIYNIRERGLSKLLSYSRVKKILKGYDEEI